MDGVVKFWDLRMHISSYGGGNDKDDAAAFPPSFAPPSLLKAVRGGHSHWTTRAMYNPFHDQLVLSGGSDGIANLWRISSCSSAPLLELNGDDEDDGNSSVGGGGGHSDMEDGKGDDAANDDEDDARANYIWAPKGDDGDDESEKEDKSKSPKNDESTAQDVRVTRFECSDVTADLAWSAADPWVYATLSHDGAIVVHHVPSKEKYKILL
jgi:WD40 repeat protein